MTTKAKPTTSAAYEVRNTRGLPVGSRVLSNGEKDWRDGDAIVPGEIEDEAFLMYIERGVIVKVGD